MKKHLNNQVLSSSSSFENHFLYHYYTDTDLLRLQLIKRNDQKQEDYYFTIHWYFVSADTISATRGCNLLTSGLTSFASFENFPSFEANFFNQDCFTDQLKLQELSSLKRDEKAFEFELEATKFRETITFTKQLKALESHPDLTALER